MGNARVNIVALVKYCGIKSRGFNMKSNILMAMAVSSIAISPVISTAAYAAATQTPDADVADPTTTVASMQAQCDALALTQFAPSGVVQETTDDGRSYNVPFTTTWEADVEMGGAGILITGPTEVLPLDRDIDPGSVVGTGGFTWGGVKIVGDPFRNGGSVNMFGNQRATEKNFASSNYDYTAEFMSTFAYSFGCSLIATTHYSAVNVPGVPGRKVQGFYTNPGAGDCKGFDETKPFWGEDQGACIFTMTGDAIEALDPVTVDARDDVANPISLPGVPVQQSQTDNLSGRELNGGPVTLAGDLFVGNPVVCISPKRLPGIWTRQNGYLGEKCTTAWFNNLNIAWNGSTTSQGTYISVPAF